MKSNNILEQLSDIFTKDKLINEFQLYEVNSTVLKAGFNNKELGGIYQPIQSHSQSRVSYLITIKDEKQSQGSLNPHSTYDLSMAVKQIKNNAFKPSHKTTLSPKLDKFTPTKLDSKKLKAIIDSTPEEIVEYTKLLFEDQKSLGLNTIESQVRMRLRNQRFISSNGNNLTSCDSLHDYYIDYNSEISTSNESCDYIPTSEFAKTHKIAELAKSLRKKPIRLENENLPIVFNPYYGFSLLDKYILENINGSAVDSKISRFSIYDFTKQKQIAKSNLTIGIDQTIPMNVDSFNFNNEGIMGQKFNIISDGKLVEQICDLQTSAKLKYSSRSISSLFSAHCESLEYVEFLKKYPKFILVLSVLGIHTQNAITGNYSLPCPSALYFENGKLVGPVNCVLTGNFFEKLYDDSFGFTKYLAFNKPLLHFNSQVSIK